MLKDESAELHELVRQQQAEIGRLRRLVDGVPGVVYWKDINGVYLGSSVDATEDVDVTGLYPFDNQSPIVGKTDFDLFPQEVAERIRQHDYEVMRTGREVTLEQPLKLPSGQTVVQLASKKPMYDECHRLAGVVGNHIDITGLKDKGVPRPSAEKAQMVTPGYDEVSRLKTEFMRNMEHDIRTPFSGVYGMASQLWQSETDENKREYLGDITRCAKELLDYCNGFLDFSKIEMGALPVESKKFDLRELVDKLIAMEVPAAKDKGIGFYMDFDHDVPRVLVGDPYRVQRVLLNLIGNAIKFTERGHVTLKIQEVCRRDRDAVVRFVVKDTGIGMPQEKISLIYEKFSRLSPSNQGVYHGLGLGLRIVKQFVTEMDGEIDVTSSAGEGSCFEVTLSFRLPLAGDVALQRME